jgi:hypothetical protein
MDGWITSLYPTILYTRWGCLDDSLVNTTQHIMEKEKEKDPAGFERGF